MRQSLSKIVSIYFSTRLMALSLVLAILSWPATSQSSSPQISELTLNEVKQQISLQFGVPIIQIKASSSLVNDLFLDRAVVYYKLLTIYDYFEVQPPDTELVVVQQIAEHVESGPGAFNFGPTKSATPSDQISEQDYEFYSQTVYFATNRNPTGLTTPAEYFSGRRVEDGKIRYGYAEVNIPKAHKVGQIESPF